MTDTDKTMLRAAALTVAAAVVAAGCGVSSTEDKGSSSAPSSPAAAPDANGVDLAALDTGGYSTEPSPPFPRATPIETARIEAQRMAEFTTLPYEIDPALSEGTTNASVMTSAQSLAEYLTPDAGKAAEDAGLLYGFATSAQAPKANPTDPSKDLVNLVMRFPSHDAAVKAARDTDSAGRTGLQTPGSPIPTSETGKDKRLPDTQISRQTSSSDVAGKVKTTTVSAYTPHGDYVIHTFAEAPESDTAWTTDVVAKDLELQGPLIDRFPALKTKEQNGGVPPELPQIDQDKMLIYALPVKDVGDKPADDKAVYGPRGMAHHSATPEKTMQALQETGAEHNAVWRTNVFRGRDDAAGASIMDHEVQGLTDAGYVPEPSPAGLPVAKCLSKVGDKGTSYRCFVRIGRYVGESTSKDDKQAGDRQISAQYVILTKADQHA